MLRDLPELLDVIRSHRDSNFEGPQTEALVNAAERRLGLRFPPSYRAFLLALGAGQFGSNEIYGVFRADFDDSGIPDTVWATLDRRRSFELERSGVVIGYDGSEGFYVLDVGRRGADETVPVVWWTPGAILEASPVVAPDFHAFLAQLADQLD